MRRKIGLVLFILGCYHAAAVAEAFRLVGFRLPATVVAWGIGYVLWILWLVSSYLEEKSFAYRMIWKSTIAYHIVSPFLTGLGWGLIGAVFWSAVVISCSTIALRADDSSKHGCGVYQPDRSDSV